MLRTVLKQRYREEQIAKIHQKNNCLHHLVSGEFDVQTFTALRSLQAEHRNMEEAVARDMNIYNTIQHQAKLLHTVLQQKLKASTHHCCQVNCDFLNANTQGWN